jgi:hypothetical protein
MTDRLHIPKGKYPRTGYVSPIDAALEIIGGADEGRQKYRANPGRPL